MPKRDWKILAEDIITSAERIEQYVSGLTFEEFVEQTLVSDAVARNLEISGEAASKIPDDVQIKYDDIPWKKLKGVRNRVIHEYFSVDLEIVWYIVQHELSPLKDELIRSLSEKKID